MKIIPSLIPKRMLHRKSIGMKHAISFFGISILLFCFVVALGSPLFILGNTLIRGVVSEKTNLQETLPVYSSFLYPNEEFVFLVNSTLPIESLELPQLFSIYQSNEFSWAQWIERSLRIVPMALSSGILYQRAQMFLTNNQGYLDSGIRQYAQREKMLQDLSQTPGGIGFLNRDDFKNEFLEQYALKVLPVQMFSALADRKAIPQRNALDMKTIEKIFRGEVQSWKELGGEEQKIVPFLIKENLEYWDYIRYVFEREGKPISAQLISVKNIDQATRTPGFILLIPFAETRNYSEMLLKTEVRKSSFNFSWNFLKESPSMAGRYGGIFPVWMNTLFFVLLTLLLCVPLSILISIFLDFYLGWKTVKHFFDFLLQVVSGLPGIVLGIFGALFFVDVLGLGIGVLSGALSTFLMIAPVIIYATRIALKDASLNYIQSAYAMGLTKRQAIVHIFLPYAFPQIFQGVMLAIGRAVAETAILLFTMGTSLVLIQKFSGSGRTLSVHLYQLLQEGISTDKAFATAFLLISISFILNITIYFLTRRKY